MRRTLARRASDAEMKVFLGGLRRTRCQFSGTTQEANQLITAGESLRDESLDPVEHAAWTSLCLAVLNLDETLNRE